MGGFDGGRCGEPKFPMQSMRGTAGIGLRHPHLAQILRDKPKIDWLEVHTENYMVDGGLRRQNLAAIAEHYPISFHGVGLSLGSAERPDNNHLQRLKALINEIGPCQVSEHISWSKLGHVYVGDLLPLPLTEEALECVSRNVAIAQDYLQQTLLMENVSAFAELQAPEMTEAEFLTRLSHKTGCGILLDVSNLIVNERNLGRSANQLLADLPPEIVGEIHLGGHEEAADGLLIDSHAVPMSPASWRLYRTAMEQLGPVATLIEWDQDLPEFHVLSGLADQAKSIMSGLNNERQSSILVSERLPNGAPNDIDNTQGAPVLA